MRKRELRQHFDEGPKRLTSCALDAWAYAISTLLYLFQPGEPCHCQEESSSLGEWNAP